MGWEPTFQGGLSTENGMVIMYEQSNYMIVRIPTLWGRTTNALLAAGDRAGTNPETNLGPKMRT